jgi:hypothetical protein
MQTVDKNVGREHRSLPGTANKGHGRIILDCKPLPPTPRSQRNSVQAGIAKIRLTGLAGPSGSVNVVTFAIGASGLPLDEITDMTPPAASSATMVIRASRSVATGI